MRFAWIAVVCAACINSSSVECKSGRLCPESTVCDDVRDLCITQAQTTACDQLADGAVCVADRTPGICDRSLCEPGCGDGHVDPDEECDDGNFASHDGCSSACKVEIPSWSLQPKGWEGVYLHTAAYSDALGRLVVVGGQTSDSVTARIWQRDPNKASELGAGWREVTSAFGTQLPPPRSGATMAYDSARGVIVLFGGGDPIGNTLSDTWEYGPPFSTTSDGEAIGTWKQITTATTPLSRFQGAMTYDAARGNMVLFGGFSNDDPNGLIFDTWTYDGSNWTQLSPSFIPGSGFRSSMAFDPTRQLVVMFGNDGQTYEWDGTNWSQPTLATQPIRRQFPAMTWDPLRGKIVMFGGRRPALTDLSDTWTYDGAWTQLSSAASPSVREAATLSPDPVNHKLVLVGGSSFAGDVLRDIWELSSTAWLEHTPQFEPAPTSSSAGIYRPKDHSLYVYGGFSRVANNGIAQLWAFDGNRWVQGPDGPFGRMDHSIGYDSDKDQLIVFGGTCTGTPDCNVDFADTTFTYDPNAGTWTNNPDPNVASLARADAALIYDPADHYFVLYGGATDQSSAQSDTWVYQNDSWMLQLPEGSGPAGTAQASIGWDPVRDAVILFDSAGVTWQYQHGMWMQLLPASSSAPIGRNYGGFDYDVQRKRFVLVGGLDAAGNRLADVWELDTAALTWTQLFVPGTTPLPRHHTVFAPVSNSREHLLYGGDAGAQQPLGDVWMLQYRSSTPDEICNDGIDNDGDKQIDGADPDCAPL